MQIGGSGRERPCVSANPRRHAAHAAVQVHAALHQRRRATRGARASPGPLGPVGALGSLGPRRAPSTAGKAGPRQLSLSRPLGLYWARFVPLKSPREC